MAATAALRRAASHVATAAVNACFGGIAATGAVGFFVATSSVPDWERHSNTTAQRRGLQINGSMPEAAAQRIVLDGLTGKKPPYVRRACVKPRLQAWLFET